MSILALLLLACHGDVDTGEGLLGDGWDNPFPAAWMVDDGELTIPPDLLPVSLDGTPLPVEQLTWRAGFSPAQVSVVRLRGVEAEALPRFDAPTPGQGGVVMADLTAGRFLACFAELDAYPDVVEPTLLIRPLEATPAGHRVAIAVTTAVVDRPERFDDLVSGDPPDSLGDHAEHTASLVDELDRLGLPAAEIALAWDYPVGDGTHPLRAALDQLDPPGTWSFTRIREVDLGHDVAPLTWRAAEGSFGVQDFLVDDLDLDLEAGTPQQVGETTAYLYAHIPISVRDQPAGSVPVLVFGHGIFASPSLYLDLSEDENGLLSLADQGGFIVVATMWRGLCAPDRVEAIEVSRDFGRFPVIPGRLLQGQVNAHTLVAMLDTDGLLADDVFRGASGQLLPDPEQVVYYGISLGGIQGPILAATGAPVEAAALHVGGAMWSTMLERSTHWPMFEIGLTETVPDPAERQLLYSASQLWWDPVDPISYAGDLGGVPLLWQESIGDEQVPNLVTRALTRSVGVPLLSPAADPPWGLDPVQSPLPPGSSAHVQYDPQVELPPEVNRPGVNHGAHHGPRTWPGARAQVLDFLATGQEGTVVHHCGTAPCSADNPGE